MKIRKLFWGLFFVVAAAIVIANQLGYFTQISLVSLLFTVVLVAIMIESLFKLNWGGILFPIAFLCIIYSEQWGITNITPWPVLIAALLGSIGLSILFHKKHVFIKEHRKENFNEIVNEEDGDTVDFGVKFSSSIKYVNSESFKRGNFASSFGAMKVYFDNTKLSEDGAQINLDVSFAAIELYIPKEWNIENKIDVSFAGVEEKNSNINNKQGPKVTLIGTVHFGGIEIIYV